IEIIIFSDNKAKNNITSNYINDFIKDTGINIVFKNTNNRFHDRYIVIDYNTNNEMIYHCGASSKDSGKKINTIMMINDKQLYKEMIEEIKNG
ncbi:MAG: ORF6N domain-containing protein, partial [bacterium]|nr:ORF6N domain-containing protein [bacterium]